MGIRERKQRHREDLRERILEAAKKLFVQEGFEATSIRKIAKEIEFSPTTIYLYYKDKNDILYALHKAGFDMLRERFVVLQAVEDAFERLKAIGRIYIDFGLKNPEFYEVMFMLKEPLDSIESYCGDEHWPEGERVFIVLETTILACQEKGYFKGYDAKAVSFQAWATVHGLITLYISQHFTRLHQALGRECDQSVLIEEAFQVLVKYLEHTR